MKKYMLNRYHKRRLEAVIFLGGKCFNCGSIENLELDHKESKKKSLSIGRSWNVNYVKFWLEIKKCQLLCKNCHIIKTRTDQGQLNAKETHGTLSSYRYCKCALCKKANSEYNKEYRVRSTKVVRSPFKRNGEGSSPSELTRGFYDRKTT